MAPYRIWIGLLLGLVLVLTAGAETRRRQWLRFFFDGVPPEKTAPITPAAVAAADSMPAIYLAARAAPPGVRHKPYADRDCTACHESQFSQKLRGEVAAICQLCHKDLLAEMPFRHAPAEAGFCLGCHTPHESPARGLLVAPSPQVCWECHEEKPLLRGPAHERIGQTPCEECHNPHGSQNRFFLKPGFLDSHPPEAAAPIISAPL